MWNEFVHQIDVQGLSERGQTLLLRFINTSDRSLAHPLAWRRFHGFIRYAHAHRAGLQPAALGSLLKRSGFSDEDANQLSLVYEHGRAILTRSTPVFHSGRFWGDK
jgi:hypothetical protein